jgi:hypothetical protein
MKRILIAICLMGTVTSCQSQNLGNILKQANDVLANASKGGLTSDEIGKGLKEALTVGIKNSSAQAGRLMDFWVIKPLNYCFRQKRKKWKQSFVKLA